jgi:hypothetical protein
MRYALAFAVTFALLAQAEAGDKREKKAVSSVPVRGTAENGPDVKKSVADLTTKIAWQSSLDAAKELARKDGKLIFWMNMLGDLNGAT